MRGQPKGVLDLSQGTATFPPKRKVIQLAYGNETEGLHGQIIALCDDGTIWSAKRSEEFEGWHEIPNVPQP